MMDFSQVKVVILEYNSHLGPAVKRSVKYEPTTKWDGITTYYGASLAAFDELLRGKGFELAYCDSHGVNAIFLNRGMVDDEVWGEVSVFCAGRCYRGA